MTSVLRLSFQWYQNACVLRKKLWMMSWSRDFLAIKRRCETIHDCLDHAESQCVEQTNRQIVRWSDLMFCLEERPKTRQINGCLKHYDL